MDFLAWIGRLVFFLAALWIALENPISVPLRLSSTLSWQNVPLLAVILGSFVTGVLAGTIAMLPKLFRLHRRLRQSADKKSARQNAEASLMLAARQGGAVGDVDFDAPKRH